MSLPPNPVATMSNPTKKVKDWSLNTLPGEVVVVLKIDKQQPNKQAPLKVIER